MGTKPAVGQAGAKGGRGGGAGSTAKRRRLQLRHLLFLLLLGSGIIPLLISNYRMIQDNQEILKTKESELLIHSAQAFAYNLSERLAHNKDQLRQLGRGLVNPPGFETLQERMSSEWGQSYLLSFADDHPELLAFRVVDQNQQGLRLDLNPVPVAVDQVLQEALTDVFRTGAPVYRLTIVSRQQDTGVVVAVPVPAGEETLVVETLVPMEMSGLMTGSGDIAREEVFLVDHQGQLLWSPGGSPEIENELLQSELVSDFVTAPSILSASGVYSFEVGGKEVSTLARVVPVPETGWGVVAHKPESVAFQQVQSMVVSAVISSVLLVVLAIVVALVAARWLSQPIQQLVEASHEIAAGNFKRRVETKGLGFEIADLAEDFNRMSDTVESYIGQLRKAAEANRELFISTIRAFAATIDAKDPYTRGHSERVAAYSRSIARYLGLPKEAQERVWIAAVLHDVGKIGIEDRILKKVGVLTPEEFDQMKLHPVIGADIVEPISALKEMIPGIRWHHEAWNGTGYPDQLSGEQIPLMARIIGVADTFDAITTTRPYQNAYSTEYAIQTIKKLTGKRFDAKIVTAFLLAYEAGHIKVDKQKADDATSKIQITTPQSVAT